MKTSSLLKNIRNIFIFSLIAFSSFATEFYVSPNGSDDNSGTKNRPFATLERAKIAVQNSIQNKNNIDFTIWIADGIYEIESPLIFNPEFFGDKINVRIKAIKKANPVISGGKVLTGWTKNENGFWVAELPEKGDWNPRELFINNKRAMRARHPNSGYLEVKKVGDDRRTNFQFSEGDFPIPENVKGVELILLHDWSISRIGVKSIDSRNNRLTAVDSIGAKSPAFFNLDNWDKNPRYFLENTIEFLDADFEWFLDSETREIYLKLPELQSPESLQIIVPFASGLIQIKGEENSPVKNIHFEG
ncbi:MAG: hypothetical protein L3J54_06940, partial [Draconibacterium sp.]|nr:hypothetical protein [Draconibacterium sp.]